MTGALDVTPQELGLLITVKTAEQEGVETVGAHLAMVCAARVVQVDPIAGSHNRKAVVETGRYGRRTVVCGAPNCRAGIVTAYIPAGCVLDGRTIEKAVIAGVESDGMLASGAELGLNRDAAGILELDVEECKPDSIIEIDNKSLTHRPDLWGHHGMAREVAAILERPLRDPVDLSVLPQGPGSIAVSIADFDLCPRYSALTLENVTVAPSPLWLQYRLTSVGLNPINNIVDVTNYVMAEIGQPMHAFDAATLAGETIHVRRAAAGEKMQGLDEQHYTLDEQALVIADANGPVAIAGVIGGLSTGVTQTTQRIVLESANFQAASIRKTSSRLKLRTDASMRFEKSLDPRNTRRGLARALVLLEQVSPGIRVVGGVSEATRELSAPAPIELRLDWLRRKLGCDVAGEKVRGILHALEFQVEETAPEVFRVTPPSWRATKDISIKDDLAEEVGRMMGYSSIEPRAPLAPVVPPPVNPERAFLQKVREVCTGQGFTEVYNYSFVNPQQAGELALAAEDHVRVLNPISSDQGLLRTSLLPGIVKNIRDNSRHLENFRLFEIGFEIHKQAEGLPTEALHLAAAVYSKAGDGVAGLMEAKRLAECLLYGAGVRQTEARPYEHTVRAYAVLYRDEVVGRVSELHPKLVSAGRAAVLYLDLERVREVSIVEGTGSAAGRGSAGGVGASIAAATGASAGTSTAAWVGEKYKPLPRYPSSSFDLSVIAGERVTVAEVEQRMTSLAGEFLQGIEFVRQYVGAPLAEGQKSLSFRVTVCSMDRTLSAEEIASVRARIIGGLEQAGFELRI
ncbi:MAG: phenylalanine--tRNA ligase subunit beta [Acidobacteriia bacterium]|nr:phenylalanine--tRNA ligase subunit beta [Terriglobia bacterium]